MRSFTSLVGVLAAFVSFGCGTTVTVMQGEDGTGGGGEGGSSSTGVSDGGGPTVIVNPPGCPATAPLGWDFCSDVYLGCSYVEAESCTVTYVCTAVDGCYGDTVAVGSGAGGYDTGSGGCRSELVWLVQEAECPAAVECGAAVQGDVCATPGDYCAGNYGECSYEDKYCGEDHRWSVSSYDDECCYDGCCYGECECWSDQCPATQPVAGAYCDPCYDSQYCEYTEQTECGAVYAYASCDWNTYTWTVESSGCSTGGTGGGWEGTTAVSVGTTTGTGMGGWGGAGGAFGE